MTLPDASPLVSIGLPVYNGEKFLRAAADSLVGQSYQNIELVICDNASTDATERLCRELAGKDVRVRYERLPANIGALPNHNRVLERSRGEFFMWSSHDDVWERTYVEECVAVLRSNPDASCAYSETGLIDEHGKAFDRLEPGDELQDPDPVRRFGQLVELYSMIEPVYGVIRMNALREAAPMPMHPAADRVVFAGLALRGRIIRIPKVLYFRRQHAQRSVKVYPKLRDRYRWVRPELANKRVWPHFDYFALMCGVLRRCPLVLADKVRGLAFLTRWSLSSWRRFISDFQA